MQGFLSVAHIVGWMRENFMYRHLFTCIAVVKEEREPLTCCDLCGMDMTVGRPLKHQQTKRCDRDMQMRWQRKDVTIASQYEGVTFSLTGKDDAECIEEVETFKYLGRILERSDEKCP